MPSRFEFGSHTRTSAQAARARSSISLGAAFALFCVVLMGYDTPASKAAGGLVDALFGPGEPPAALFYNGFAPRYYVTSDERAAPRRRLKEAKRPRAHVLQARRRILERRKFVNALHRSPAPADARRSPGNEIVEWPKKLAAAAQPAPGVEADGTGRRVVCVRACDGYRFPAYRSPALPVSRATDVAGQRENCEKLCPGAQATLFVLPTGSDKPDEAKSAAGESHTHFIARPDPSDARSKSCACQTEASASAAAASAFLWDSTLRPGDTVVTPQGVRVVRRGSRFPFKASDFLSLAETDDAPLSNRSALYAIERALKTPQGRLDVAHTERRAGGREPRL